MRERAKFTEAAGREAVAELVLVCFGIADARLSVLTTTGEPRTLPRALLRAGEAPHATAEREAARLLGVAPRWSAQAVTVHRTGAPPLAIVHVVAAPAEAPAPLGTQWMRISAISRVGTHDAALVADALREVRDRLDHAPVAFRLLPPTFTLSELQMLYETLLGRRLHKASFRRSLAAANLVASTDAWRREGRGRPAQLYRFAPSRPRGRTAKRPLRFDLLR